MASEVDPASYSDAYTYDASKNVLTLTDKRGKVWTYTYDSKGNVLTAKNPLNHTTTYTYSSAFNFPLTVTDPLSNVTTIWALAISETTVRLLFSDYSSIT